jgi:Ca2+/Na+ antiporter
MAGETRGAERAIGRSVVSLHGVHPRTAINYIAPIPQTLTLAFGEHGPAALIAAMLVLGTAGVHAAVAFGLLNDASSEFYALAYLVMFLIPICGDPILRRRLPRAVAWICGAGVVTILFIFMLNAVPFVGEVRPGVFAAKVPGTTLLVNAIGWLFYRVRRGRAATAFGDASF